VLFAFEEWAAIVCRSEAVEELADVTFDLEPGRQKGFVGYWRFGWK
jgi:hypothetical protein